MVMNIVRSGVVSYPLAVFMHVRRIRMPGLVTKILTSLHGVSALRGAAMVWFWSMGGGGMRHLAATVLLSTPVVLRQRNAGGQQQACTQNNRFPAVRYRKISNTS